MLVWAFIALIPSVILHPWINQDLLNTTPKLQALFLTVHYMMAGLAIYFVLTGIKKESDLRIGNMMQSGEIKPEQVKFEKPGALRYLIAGVLTAVMHSVLFALYTGVYFNYVNTETRDAFATQVLEKAVVHARDTQYASINEYYQSMLIDLDTAFMLPETYERYKQAATDSLVKMTQEYQVFKNQNFGFYGLVLRWTGFAPLIGLLFSAVVLVFAVRN